MTSAPSQPDPTLPRATLESRHGPVLNVLAVLHYLLGALTLLANLASLLFSLLGLFFFTPWVAGHIEGDTAPLFLVNAFINVLGIALILIASVTAVAIILAGRALHRRRSRSLVIAVAALECILFPLGTVLGVITLVMVCQDEVKPLFDPPSQAP